jgi:DNA-binding transcriptional LysR family regulator
MLNWDDLKFCLALHRHGTMQNAGKSLGANVATVSRRLERATGVYGETLFKHNGNQWEATAAGENLVKIAAGVEESLVQVSRTPDDVLSEDAVIKLSVSPTIIETFFNHIAAYRDAQKRLFNIDLTLHDRSLAYSEVDVAVRFARPEHGKYICAKIAEMELCAFVSADAEQPPTDWVEVNYDGNRITPRDFNMDIDKKPKLRLEGLNLAVCSMVQQNYVGFLPKEYGKQFPTLRQLENECLKPLPIWMIYHESRKLDPLVRIGSQIVQASLGRQKKVTSV